VRSGHDTDPSIPRAHIHREILDAAADAPDASLDAIADEVPSATADLVDRVLAEYGDPAAASGESAETEAPATVTGTRTPIPRPGHSARHRSVSSS
jgi:hypothetical protein